MVLAEHHQIPMIDTLAVNGQVLFMKGILMIWFYQLCHLMDLQKGFGAIIPMVETVKEMIIFLLIISCLIIVTT